MVSLISTSKAQKKLAENIRNRRLSMELTQEGLSKRSGVPDEVLKDTNVINRKRGRKV